MDDKSEGDASPQYDVMVVGGGAAGVGAAVGAAQAGARTLLIEDGPCLGGAATQKNVLGYCGLYTMGDPPMQAVFGVAEQMLACLRTLGGVQAPALVQGAAVALVDPEAIKLALDRVVTSAGVEVQMHTSVIAAAREGDHVKSATLQDHQGSREVAASVFVDASGEGDLAAFAGASVHYGDHGVTQAGTLAVRIGGIALGADMSSERWKQAIREARQRGSTLLDKEEGTLFKVPVSGDWLSYMVDATYNALEGASITQAEVQGRERAWAYLAAIKTIPGYEGAYIVSSGPNFGTRQSRRVVGKYQVTELDVIGGARHEDVVALGAWPVEYHTPDGGPVVWKDIKDKATFDIPLRALASVNTVNLYSAGRLVDGDKDGGAAMRVMGTSFATGQAAGVAAALQSLGTTDTQAVQTELERQDAKLRWSDKRGQHHLT